MTAFAVNSGGAWSAGTYGWNSGTEPSDLAMRLPPSRRVCAFLAWEIVEGEQIRGIPLAPESLCRLETMANRRPLLYLVDGSNALHRAFHAIRSLNNSKGFPTNAIYGFAAILRKLVREHKPTHVGIAFDVSESAARKEAYADYKAQRKPMADDLAV